MIDAATLAAALALMKTSGGGGGEPGFSPTVQITEVEGGTQVTITDANGPHTFTVLNGTNGADGTDGAAAGFGTPTATVDGNVGTPSVTVTASGPDTAKVFTFAFSNLKGATGARGPAGANGQNGTTPVKGVDYFTEAEVSEIEAAAAGAALPSTDGVAEGSVLTVTTGGVVAWVAPAPTA